MLILVVGVGRSGTSLVSGILGQLGFHIPQPEVVADETNPKGFGEPRWVVDFHTRLMSERRVIVFDARPVAAWKATDAAAADEAVFGELRGWLSGELAQEDVLVKDPRIGWFLPLWRRVADDLQAPTAFITMLRHPAEILASAKRSYGTWQSDASRAAAWINVMLRTEHSTRDARRVFIRYDALLANWHAEIGRAGEALGIERLARIERDPAVDAFVDPSLYRAKTTWEDLEVPASVQRLADEVWDALCAADQPRLDAARAAYETLYGEAEAIAQPSIAAVRPRKRKAPPTLRARVLRKIPKRVRDRLRGR